MRTAIVILGLLVSSLSSCTPVEMARFDCRNGDQSACIDYMAYTHAGLPGTAASYIQQQRAAGLAPSPYDANEVPRQSAPASYDPNTNF